MVSLFHASQNLIGFLRETRKQRSEEDEARVYREAYSENINSGLLDTGGLAEYSDLYHGGMLGGGQLFLGEDSETGELLFDDGDYSIIAGGMPGIGKGLLIQTNLGHIGNDTSVVTIGLGLENYLVTATYRQDGLGQQVFLDNADGLYGISGITVDPVLHFRILMARTDLSREEKLRKLEDLADEFREVGVPEKPEDRGESGWIVRDARPYYASLVKFAAADMPHLCYLPEMYEFASLPVPVQFDLILEHTTVDSVRKTVSALQEEFKSGAEKQVVWIIKRVRESLEMYRKGTARGDALAGPIFDPTVLRKEPATLYFECSERGMQRDADHIARAITSLVNVLSDATGPQKILFNLDEFSQMPKMPIDRWIRTERKKRIRFLMWVQSQESGEEIYGQRRFSDILVNCGCKLWLSVASLQKAQELSARAGDYTVWNRSTNVGRGGYSAGEGMVEQSIPRLSPPDILNMPRHGLLIERTGMPLIKAIRRPWWDIEPYCDRLRHFDDIPEFRRS